MYYAYANKDQMKVWKSARKAENDGYPEPPTTKVMLRVKTKDTGMVATLTATDSYQMMQRNICVGDDYREGSDEVQIPIPGADVAIAEKTMKPGDRAYFADNSITVMHIEEDEHGEERELTKATIPFLVQEELFKNWDDLLQREEQDGTPAPVYLLDAKALKLVVDQFKSGNASVYIGIGVRQGDTRVILSAFDDIEDEAIKAVIMPIKS